MGTREHEDGRERGQGVRAMGLVWETLPRLPGPAATHHTCPTNLPYIHATKTDKVHQGEGQRIF